MVLHVVLDVWPSGLRHDKSSNLITKHMKNVFILWDITHWGRVTHICVVKLTIIGSDNGLSPGRRQAIIWTNAEILVFGPLGTNYIEILIGIQTFSFKKMHLKMSSAKWRPFCLGRNVIIHSCDSKLQQFGIGLGSGFTRNWWRTIISPNNYIVFGLEMSLLDCSNLMLILKYRLKASSKPKQIPLKLIADQWTGL